MKKILIVDNDPIINEMVTEIIKAEKLIADDKIFSACNGSEALKIFELEKPNLVITDMMMPVMSGNELIEQIRKNHPETEIIVMTGFADMDRVVAVIESGVSDIIRKPFRPHELLMSIRKIAQRIKLKRENEEYVKKLHQSEKLSSIGLLASGIAHEINNPNTFVKGNLELIRKMTQILEPVIRKNLQQDDPDAAKIQLAIEKLIPTINAAIDGSERIAIIVSNLLAFSRSSSGVTGRTLVKKSIDQSLSLISSKLKYIELKLDCPSDLKEINSKDQELVQVIMNLLVNACDAIDEKYGERKQGGMLEVTVTDNDESQTVCIKDNGSGISAANAEKIFDPFFTTKEIGKGTGLGLSIVKGMVEGWGGTINYTTSNEGTTFQVVIPHYSR